MIIKKDKRTGKYAQGVIRGVETYLYANMVPNP
jgi:uncharacterized protein YwbE